MRTMLRLSMILAGAGVLLGPAQDALGCHLCHGRWHSSSVSQLSAPVSGFTVAPAFGAASFVAPQVASFTTVAPQVAGFTAPVSFGLVPMQSFVAPSALNAGAMNTCSNALGAQANTTNAQAGILDLLTSADQIFQLLRQIRDRNGIGTPTPPPGITGPPNVTSGITRYIVDVRVVGSSADGGGIGGNQQGFQQQPFTGGAQSFNAAPAPSGQFRAAPQPSGQFRAAPQTSGEFQGAMGLGAGSSSVESLLAKLLEQNTTLNQSIQNLSTTVRSLDERLTERPAQDTSTAK